MYCFSRFCRLCINSNINLVNLFCIERDSNSLSKEMRSLMPEIVHEDSIPNLICGDCFKIVKQMYEFKNKCLKNNEILKLYASKLLNIKENPEDENLENELKLLQKENSDVDLSIIFLKRESIFIKSEMNEPINLNIKSESDIIENYELKTECSDEESFSGDQGDESMDFDEVISVNDSGDDLHEPMNLTSKSLNNSIGSEQSNLVLPPHLASGNRGKTRTNDKYRMVYTEHQRLELEKEYLLNRFVHDRRRAELAISLGLTVRQIKIWFQNRRAKERRETKRSDSSPQDNSTTKNIPKPPQKPPTNIDKSRKTNETPAPEDFLRKQQEYFIQQQLLNQQREILVQEQLLRQRKEFLNQQQNLNITPYQQEILRQEEYIRQQKQFFTQQQEILRQQNLLPIINQPILLSQILQNQVLPQNDLSEIVKDVQNKDLIPNFEELYRRKQELLKRNEKK